MNVTLTKVGQSPCEIKPKQINKKSIYNMVRKKDCTIEHVVVKCKRLRLTICMISLLSFTKLLNKTSLNFMLIPSECVIVFFNFSKKFCFSGISTCNTIFRFLGHLSHSGDLFLSILVLRRT